MPDFTTLTAATATYSGRWKRGGRFCNFRVWTPDNPAGGGNVSGYDAPPWQNVVVFKHGGAKMNPNDLDLNTNSTALMLINELSAVIVSYDTTPSGFYESTALEPDALYWPETHQEDAEFISWLGANATNTTIFGTGKSIQSANRNTWMHYGSSSGAWDVLKTQCAREGDFPLPTGALQRGEARFAANTSYYCNVVLVSQPQTMLATFVKSKHASPAPASYTVNGAHSAGVSTITIAGGTGRFLKGNRIQFNGTGQVYAIDADSAASPTSVAIYPTLQTGVSNGATVDLVTTGLEKYADQGWCGGYFFPSNSGYVWNDDATLTTPAVYPWENKRQADVDKMLTSDNPRVREVSWVFVGASGNELIKSTAGTSNEFAFLKHVPGPYGTLADGAIDSAHNDLHGEWQSFYIAWLLDQLGNTTNVALYAGNTTSNPNVEVNATNWNKGQNADFSASVLKTFLQARGW